MVDAGVVRVDFEGDGWLPRAFGEPGICAGAGVDADSVENALGETPNGTGEMPVLPTQGS